MAKVLVLYHSMYGHVEQMAYQVADGVKSVEGVTVDVKRVPELMDDEAFKAAGGKTDQNAPIAEPNELADYDAIIIGTPTRFGNMSAQMRNFWDRTGSLWAKGALVGKIGSVFASTGTRGGQETTITATWHTLAHHGMLIMPLSYGNPALAKVRIGGGSPYGAAVIAGADGSRTADDDELAIAYFQGEEVAKLAKKLVG